MAAQPIAHDDSAVSRLIAKVDGMAVLPHVVFRVLEISNAAESSIADLDRAIAVDPGFSAKVLTMANSAYFGLPRQVTSIRDALVFLGIKTIRNLAMTIGVFDLFVGKTDKESLRRRAWWRHSLDTAIAAKYLAMISRKSNPDDAYTCGLMHLIGKTLMDRYGGLDYGNVLHLVGCGWDEEKAEQSVYGFTHVEASVAAADHWGFPEVLVNGLDYRHPGEPGEAWAPQRACTALASAICDSIAGSEDGPENLPSWAISCLELGHLSDVELREKIGEAIAKAGMAA